MIREAVAPHHQVVRDQDHLPAAAEVDHHLKVALLNSFNTVVQLFDCRVDTTVYTS
jgi:hypothetical protein